MTLLETKKLEGIGSVQDLQQVVQYIRKMANILVTLSDDLDHVVNGNLDVKNIRAKSITAELINVDKLSAISADLGKVVAGILIGAYISTADGTFPRIDFASTVRLLTAYLDANNYLAISPDAIGGTPTLYFHDNGAMKGSLSMVLGHLSILSIGSSNIYIGSANDLYLYGGSGNFVVFKSWSEVKSGQTGNTLQQDLNNLQSQINGKANSFSGFTGTFYVSSTPGGPTDLEVIAVNGIIASVS